MNSKIAKIGASLYVIWGLLHLVAAYKVFLLGSSLEAGMVQGRVYQNAWNLLFFAIFGTAVAIMLNWKNDRMGYWLNAIVVSAGDIGFVLFVLLSLLFSACKHHVFKTACLLYLLFRVSKSCVGLDFSLACCLSIWNS